VAGTLEMIAPIAHKMMGNGGME